MRWYLSDRVGDGLDDATAFRPRVADHTNARWWATAPGEGGLWLVKAEATGAFDGIASIAPMAKAALADFGVPLLDVTDDAAAPDLAMAITRRLLIRQWLGADDFASDATAKLADLDPVQLDRMRTRLAAYQGGRLDLTDVRSGKLVGDAIGALLPQFDVRVLGRAQRPNGTFTDDFSGEASTVDLASHTPSGGTAWTRNGGAANYAQVHSDGSLYNNTADSTGAFYSCDDQGSPDQYTEVTLATYGNMFVVQRCADANNFIGCRSNASGAHPTQLYKRDAGSFTKLGEGSASGTDDVLRVESSGDAHELFLNSVSDIGPTTDAFNNTETGQGVVARQYGASAWLKEFEAGTLSAGAIPHGVLSGPFGGPFRGSFG